jgi:hypothetical protein
MRVPILLALLLLTPALALAEVQWHKFGIANDRETIALGRVTVTVETQKVQNSGFPDDLIITVKAPGRKPSQFHFTSSYGYGSVAIHQNLLLLKYGIGRGTAGARVEHVKALRLDHDLDELVDVQCSYFIVTNPHNAGPDEFQYRLNARVEGGYTTLSFSLPKPQRGIPSEKIVRIKNDG